MGRSEATTIRRVLEGHATGTLWHARDFWGLIRASSRERAAGIIDFSYQHYALGDILTSLVNLSCIAEERACSGVDLYLLIHPDAPSAPGQRFITPENYRVHLDNLFPAFLCCPALRSIRLIRDPFAASLSVLSLVASRVPMWPSFSDHIRARMVFPMPHDIINGFHARHGYIPLLGPPAGYARWARTFLERHFPGCFVVCINPRQSRLTAVPATTYRDAYLADWYGFLDLAGRRYPDVHFFMLGGFSEWEHALLSHNNVTIPRTMGLTLAHELALLHASNLFMGTSSGFATAATFSRVPYVITHIEHVFSAYAGVPVGAERYPFAGENQYLVWRREDTGLLLTYFEKIYAAARGHGSGPVAPLAVRPPVVAGPP